LANQKEKNASFSINMPSDLDYVPPLRQFISDISKGEGFSKKFCFRTEIIVDELCTNGIVHGSQEMGGIIIINAEFDSESVKLTIKNQGGTEEDFDRLKQAIENPKSLFEEKRGRGIAIAQVLCDKLDIEKDKEGFTQVVVIKKSTISKQKSLEDNILYGRES
jgi:anti-sigma regulatory factor (Ser/Thr protein kinase)